ncbi:MAG: PqiC family protein [Desulfobacteraceae bacterium]|nr:PqiC family protein [Desulfobacteraceae bacterium]
MKKYIFCGIVAAFAMMIPGCSAFNTPPKQVDLYTLAYPAPEAVKAGKTVPVRLAVKPFRVFTPYSSDRIVYAENKHHRSMYVYHKWIAKPGEIVGSLVIRDIRAAQIVEAVFYEGGQNPNHTLECTLEAFYEDDSQDPWEAVLAVNLILTKNHPANSGSQILLQKTYQTRKALEQNNPLGLARAMSRALEGVTERMIKDIQKSLNAS